MYWWKVHVKKSTQLTSNTQYFVHMVIEQLLTTLANKSSQTRGMAGTKFAATAQTGPPSTDGATPWTFHTGLILPGRFVWFVIYPIGCMEGISLLHSAEWNLHDQYPAPAKVDTQIVALGQIAGGNNGTLGEVNIYGGPKHLIR